MVPEGVQESRFQPAGNDDSITGGRGSINSPYHVLVVIIKTFTSGELGRDTDGSHCTSKDNISGF